MGGGGLFGFGGVEVGLFDVFEVAVGLDLELGAGVFVADDYGIKHRQQMRIAIETLDILLSAVVAADFNYFSRSSDFIS